MLVIPQLNNISRNLPMHNILELEKKLRQDFVFDKIKQLVKKKFATNPLVVEFDPTTLCDLACPGCISGDLLNNKSLNFSDYTILDIAKQIIDLGVKGVVLIGGGEPLLPKVMGEVIKLFGQNDVHIGITTNGTMIGRYLNEISEYVNWTRVSVDASSDEMFKYLRPNRGGKSKFKLVIDNMKMLVKAKKKENSVGFSFLIRTEADGNATIETLRKGNHKNLVNETVISKSNIDEIYTAAKLAKDIGCNYFELKPSYDLDEHALINHGAETINRIKNELNKCYDLEDNTFKILKSIGLKYLLSNQSLSQPKSYNNCPIAELRTLITPSGVYVCPYKRGDNNFKIGDLRENNLKKIWASDKRKNVMEKLNPSIHCTSHCIRDESNKFINNFDTNIINESVIDFDRFI